MFYLRRRRRAAAKCEQCSRFEPTYSRGVEAIPGVMADRGIEAGVRALGLESPETAEAIRQREALEQQSQSGMRT